MAITVLEALENAQINFETSATLPGSMRDAIFGLAQEQLKNAIEALESGMGPNDEMQEHMFALSKPVRAPSPSHNPDTRR